MAPLTCEGTRTRPRTGCWAPKQYIPPNSVMGKLRLRSDMTVKVDQPVNCKAGR